MKSFGVKKLKHQPEEKKIRAYIMQIEYKMEDFLCPIECVPTQGTCALVGVGIEQTGHFSQQTDVQIPLKMVLPCSTMCSVWKGAAG